MTGGEDTRLRALGAWARQQLGLRQAEVRPASADASFRRYFRLSDGTRSWIAMDAPPEREDSRPYVDVAARLRRAGLQAPPVLATDLARGFLLIGDLGRQAYLQVLDGDSAERLYGLALDALFTLQTRVDGQGLPDYDETLLRAELALFPDWYLGRHLGRRLTAAQARVLHEAFDRLVEAALAQPRCVVHRDYHSRNLMLTEDGQVGILDFQDAVIGPVTYDLVSLLRDCYIAWPPARVSAWAEGYRRRLEPAGLAMPAAAFERAFDLMGVQRHLKAIGIFARLNHRDGKPGYLDDIPRTLGYVLEASARQPELAGLRRLLAALGLDARLAS